MQSKACLALSQVVRKLLGTDATGQLHWKPESPESPPATAGWVRVKVKVNRKRELLRVEAILVK